MEIFKKLIEIGVNILDELDDSNTNKDLAAISVAVGGNTVLGSMRRVESILNFDLVERSKKEWQ